MSPRKIYRANKENGRAMYKTCRLSADTTSKRERRKNIPCVTHQPFLKQHHHRSRYHHYVLLVSRRNRYEIHHRTNPTNFGRTKYRQIVNAAKKTLNLILALSRRWRNVKISCSSSKNVRVIIKTWIPGIRVSKLFRTKNLSFLLRTHDRFIARKQKISSARPTRLPTNACSI